MAEVAAAGRRRRGEASGLPQLAAERGADGVDHDVAGHAAPAAVDVGGDDLVDVADADRVADPPTRAVEAQLRGPGAVGVAARGGLLRAAEVGLEPLDGGT